MSRKNCLPFDLDFHIFFVIIISLHISHFCAGYYVAHTQSSSTLNKSEEEMYNEMQKELEIGCNECPEVKAGFIGEVGSTWPIEGKRSDNRTSHTSLNY